MSGPRRHSLVAAASAKLRLVSVFCGPYASMVPARPAGECPGPCLGARLVYLTGAVPWPYCAWLINRPMQELFLRALLKERLGRRFPW
jgi:hypothetical protein